jgi:hypothetical protein
MHCVNGHCKPLIPGSTQSSQLCDLRREFIRLQLIDSTFANSSGRQFWWKRYVTLKVRGPRSNDAVRRWLGSSHSRTRPSRSPASSWPIAFAKASSRLVAEVRMGDGTGIEAESKQKSSLRPKYSALHQSLPVDKCLERRWIRSLRRFRDLAFSDESGCSQNQSFENPNRINKSKIGDTPSKHLVASLWDIFLSSLTRAIGTAYVIAP